MEVFFFLLKNIRTYLPNTIGMRYEYAVQISHREVGKGEVGNFQTVHHQANKDREGGIAVTSDF